MFTRRSSPHRLLSVGLLLSGALACCNAFAVSTPVCVDNATDLYTKLTFAGLTNQSFTIKIVQGTYVMPGGLVYNFPKPITVEGGYTANCAARVVDPANTIINIGAGHAFQWSQGAGSPTAEINVEGVTFSNSNQPIVFVAGTLGQFSNDEGSVRLRQIRFTQIHQNSAFSYGAVSVRAYNAPMELENILIDHVSAPSTCGIDLNSIGHGSVTISHVTADLTGDDDFCLDDDGSTAVFSISNSVLWSSDGPVGLPIFSGVLNGQSAVKLTNDIYKDQFTAGAVTELSHIITDPKWVNPAAGDYRSQNVSPAINSGTLFPPGGEPATDIEGHARVIGSKPDRGAYESLISDFSSVFVKNTNDSGADSLRDAITIANNSGTPKLIKFDIRNQANVPLCPAVIGLTSALPLISGNMTIDGYTQSGSTVNTSTSAFNANLCVIVKPASGTLPSGFTIAFSPGSLKLRGLAIGGFGQPVRILSGPNSQIAGNQFGGTSHGVDLPGAGLNAIVLGEEASGDIIIGGSALGDRNLVGDAGSSGIYSNPDALAGLTSCQIVNNLVGMAPDGIAALPNNVGIDSFGSGCQIIGNRVAGNAYANLRIQGTQNVVQQNLVGFNAQGAGFLSNAIGILVTGSDNIIGAGGNGGSITANTVRHSFGGGVVVQGNMATGNSINANRVYDNGAAINRMDIDLVPTGGVAGPTLNDEGDADTGSNDLQNFPVLKGLAYTAPGGNDRPGTVTGFLNTLPGSYRVDVYFSNDINSNNKRGHAEIILTHVTVQVPASGKLSFSVPISVPNQGAGGTISMTATNSVGSTSEISMGLSTDVIFADGIN